ncbi:hypothetical protein M3629_04370 [Paenibacillus polysaccharolyticus]|uniref:hypothetical protein n=1 Tax=Paenibacillus polysaccharolyticus TaxID=582692 RepID=UPI0020420461|nr:hypothetical protein [Paenibacillus polysaccharolyticus]MCM3132005.1 hypothetical protein [Paenibacillus polysaccharolyticus]
MIGNYRINLGAGIVGFVLTFFVAFSSNVLMTSLIRGLIGFAAWYVLAYGLRWGLGILFSPSVNEAGYASEGTQDLRGSQVDIKLEDDGQELNDLLKNGQGDSAGVDHPPSETKAPTGFSPLDPPKLVRTKEPEELAQAVRHLTDK